MTVTLTIKQVPEAVADGLRRRAAANHRSMQRELLLIIERAASGDDVSARIAEPASVPYAQPASAGKAPKFSRPSRAGKLSLEQLWQRARKLGAPMPGESAAIVRRDRDARQRR